MPRKGTSPRHTVFADPVFNSPLVTQLINKIVESACVRYQIKARGSGEHPAVEAPRSNL